MHGSKLICELFFEPYSGIIISGFTLTLLLKLRGCFKNRAGLHFRYLGMKNAKTASATSEHWVFLMKRFDPFDYEIKGTPNFSAS